MNGNVPTSLVLGLIAIAVGLVNCFWGYRLLKLALGVAGLIAGATFGWQAALSLAPGQSGVALIAAIVCGLIGSVLCLWLFLLGIFLLGASAGTVAAAAFFNASGTQPQPLLVLGAAVLFGLIALILQKMMIVISTAFGGAYLVAAGALQLISGNHNLLPLWFSHPQTGGVLGYGVLILWLVLGIAGASSQFRGRVKTVPAEPPKPQA